jgi:hypothetical protein
MLAVFFSLVAATASVASLVTVRQVKRDHDAAMAALRPFADGLVKANQCLLGKAAVSKKIV